jgi:hypothetical protein
MPVRMQIERNPYILWVGMSINAATVEINIDVPQKNLKIELSCNPAVPL